MIWEILVQKALQLWKFLEDSLKFQAHEVVHLIDFYVCFSPFMLVVPFLNLHAEYDTIKKGNLIHSLFPKHLLSTYWGPDPICGI